MPPCSCPLVLTTLPEPEDLAHAEAYARQCGLAARQERQALLHGNGLHPAGSGGREPHGPGLCRLGGKARVEVPAPVSFFASGKVISVLLGNASTLTSTCTFSRRAAPDGGARAGRRCRIGVSRMVRGACIRAARAYREAMEALAPGDRRRAARSL